MFRRFLTAKRKTGSARLSTATVRRRRALTVSKFDATGAARLTVKLQGLTTGEHLVNVKFNDLDLGQVSFNNQENRQFEFDLPASALIEGANSVKLQSVGTGNDVSLVDTDQPELMRDVLKPSSDKIRFSVSAGQTARIGGFSTGKVNVFEIQNSRVASPIGGCLYGNGKRLRF